jgi:hypothetical protein
LLPRSTAQGWALRKVARANFDLWWAGHRTFCDNCGAPKKILDQAEASPSAIVRRLLRRALQLSLMAADIDRWIIDNAYAAVSACYAFLSSIFLLRRSQL